ncbi:MAG: methyltransferase domain-containing protein, partial [Clostridia bacterium]|nr:methyltransferase domain-containing protein [Clostridia bacterium]
ALRQEDKRYLCASGHCFDRAKNGYVNLLPPTASAKRHGDDKLMVRARTEFLNKGFYDPLADKIASCIAERMPLEPCVVDAGCGEGMYTVKIHDVLVAAGKQPQVIGIDISKEALIAASKRSRSLMLAAASTAKLPLAAERADCVANIFSPFLPEEFGRVLKKGGLLVRVVPLEKHLWELKQLVYDTPYMNPPLTEDAAGFRLTEKKVLHYEITLHGGEINDLFRMTPYYYKTGEADQKKAEQAEQLTTTLDFGIWLYEKC